MRIQNLIPVLCLILVHSVGASEAAIAAERPNIIFLFADDQRADTIGAHGNPHIQTPNLDRLTAEGFSFRRNYCAGSFSGAVCVASRAMLMSVGPRTKGITIWVAQRPLP